MATAEQKNRLAQLLQARYHDGKSSTVGGPWSPAIDLMMQHKSHRKFLPDKPLPEGTLEALIGTGSSAPTSSLLQTWSIVAIQDPEHKARIATLAGDQDFIRQAPLFLVMVADIHRITKVVESQGSEGKGLDTLDMFVMPVIDCALVAQNMTVAAESLGLGTCYVGAIRNNCADVCELLQLPHRTLPVFGMAVGYPDPSENVATKPRFQMDSVLHRETWGNGEWEKEEQSRLQSWNRILGDFYTTMGKGGRTVWTKFVVPYFDSGLLDGRERLGKVARERGWNLQ